MQAPFSLPMLTVSLTWQAPFCFQGILSEICLPERKLTMV